MRTKVLTDFTKMEFKGKINFIKFTQTSKTASLCSVIKCPGKMSPCLCPALVSYNLTCNPGAQILAFMFGKRSQDSLTCS